MNTVEKIRGFNRFYTSVMSLLNNRYLHSDFSMTEARILYELYENRGCHASFLVHKLGIDKSYLSRILKKFEQGNLLSRVPSKSDTRSYCIMLTDEGIAETKKLIDCSNAEIFGMIAHLSAGECKKLENAIDTITNLLSKQMEG